jgi:hypothetical protein
MGIPLRPDPAALMSRSVSSVARAIIVKAAAKYERRRDEAAILKERFDDPTASLILRAAMSPNSLATTTALSHTVVADLISTIGPVGAGARLLQAGLKLTFDSAAAISVPSLEASANVVSFVGEGAPIPVHSFVSKAVTLAPHKLAAIITLTSEMLAGSNAEALVTDALTRSVGLALDAVVLDSVAGDTVRPAGLRNGIAALTASVDANLDAAMAADIAALGGAVSVIGEPIILIAAPARAIAIVLRARRELPFQVLPSPALAGTADVIAIAGTGLASAFDAVPQIEASKIAVAHMEDATPLQIASGAQGAGVLATPTRSLWQSDTIGIKIRFNASWALRDPRALAWLTARW